MRADAHRPAVIMIIVALFTGTLWGSSGQEYGIRVTLEPGERFRIGMVYELTQDGYGSKDILSMAVSMNFTVVERNGSAYRLRAAYDSLAVKSEGLFGMDASSGADLSEMDDDITDEDYLLCLLFKGMIGLPFEVVVDERWDVQGVEKLDTLQTQLVERVMALAKLDNPGLRQTLLEATGKVFTAQRLTEVLRTASAGYPAKPLAVGESWTDAERNNAESLSYLTDATYTLAHAGWAELLIDVNARVRPDTAEDAQKIVGTQTGSMIIDRRTGLVLSAHIKQALELEMSGYSRSTTVGLTGEGAVWTDFPADEQRAAWRRAVETQDSVYGHGAMVLIGVASAKKFPFGREGLSALKDLTRAVRRLAGSTRVESLVDVLCATSADGVVEVAPCSTLDSSMAGGMAKRLRSRRDIAGRLLARGGDAALVEASFSWGGVRRRTAHAIRGVLTAASERYPDIEFAVTGLGLGGYCRVTPDTVIGWGALSDQWSRWFGSERDRAAIARFAGGLTVLEYSFESGVPGGVCDGPFASRIDSFIAWARGLPQVARVTSVFDFLPLLDSLPAPAGAQGSDSSVSGRAERLALLDMGCEPPGVLPGRVSPALSAVRVSVLVGEEDGAADTVWAQSLKWLREMR